MKNVLNTSFVLDGMIVSARSQNTDNSKCCVKQSLLYKTVVQSWKEDSLQQIERANCIIVLMQELKSL